LSREIKYEEIGVELIDYMGSDLRVSNVAKVSFNKWDDESVEINDKQKGLLSYLATGLPSSERDDWEKRAKASTHFTPYGHCFLTLRCSAPIFLARQLVKHQIGLCWNEESRRYITEDVALWLPEAVHKKPENAKQGASADVHEDAIFSYIGYYGEVYEEPMDMIRKQAESAVETYYRLIEGGVAGEEARMVLPLNAVTHWIWSGSLMAFMRVVKQRVDSHAQGAAQEFGHKLLAILEDKFPESVKAFELSA
jgi:thymidylate synthase (FAD)